MGIEESIGGAVGMGITAGIGLAVLKKTQDTLNPPQQKKKKKKGQNVLMNTNW